MGVLAVLALCALCLVVGFAGGWLAKPGGPKRGRCNAPLPGGRFCRKKPKRGNKRCGRHPETATAAAAPRATVRRRRRADETPAPAPAEATP